MTRRLAMLALALLPLAASAQDAPADGVARISQEDFKKALKADAVLVIDVRDSASYGLGHIPGALSVPEAKLSEHFEALRAQKKPIVAYCGWVNEHTSARVALTLDGLGLKGVKALLGGYRQWTAEGNPVAQGSEPK